MSAFLDAVTFDASGLVPVIAQEARNQVLERVIPRSEVSFFFSIVDSNTGR